MLPHSLIHSLRERFLRRPRWLLQAGTDIRTVQELLGHSDVSTGLTPSQTQPQVKSQLAHLLRCAQAVARKAL